MTPVDSAYLKQALRRFRQNKAKRDKTKATSTKSPGVKKEPVEEKKTKKPKAVEEKPAPKTRTVHIPGMGVEYPSKIWAESDFA